jgi:autotransporter-associated beta strand protein
LLINSLQSFSKAKAFSYLLLWKNFSKKKTNILFRLQYKKAYSRLTFGTYPILILLILSNFNTITQAAIITSTGSGGTWNSTATWSGNIIPNPSDDVVIASGATITMDADYITSASLTLNGTGDIELAGFNLTAGSLIAAGSSVINNSGAASSFSVGSLNSSTTFTGTIIGAISIIKNGSGTLTLSGTNAYTGSTTISSGTLQIGAVGAIPNLSAVVANGTLDLSGNNQTIGSLAGSGIVTSSVAGAITLTEGGDNTNTIFSGIIQDGSGTLALAKNGTGTLTLSGNNTYSGTTTLSLGTFNINSATAIGSGTFIIHAATTIDNTSGGAITLSNNNPQNWNGDFTFTGTQNLNIGTGAVSMSGSRQVRVNAATLIVGGIISGAFRLTKAGAGILTLSGVNAFTGGTTLNAGTLNINNSQALGTVAGTFIINGGTIDNTSGSTITTLNYPQDWNNDFVFTGTQNLNLGTGVVSMIANRLLTVNGSILTIGGIISGTGFSLSKAGLGTLSLTGANTFTGGTNLNTGTLLLGNTAALGAIGSTVTLNGGILDLATDASINAYNITVGGAATIASDKATAASAGITHSFGTLSIGNFQLNETVGSNVTSGTAGLLFGTTTFTANTPIFDIANNANLTLGALTGNFNFTKQNSGQLTLNTSSVRSSGISTLTAGKMVLGNASALGTIATTFNINGGTLDLATDASVNAYNITVGGSSTITSDKATAASAGIVHTLGTLSIGNNTLTIAGGSNVISGTAGVTFGAVTLTAAPTFTISNPASGGVTQLSLGGVTNGANLATFNGNGNVIQTGAWGNGSGGITYGGTGTLTLNQANTYTGTTTLNSGQFNINNATAIGTGTFAINGGTIDNTSGGAIILSNNNIQNWNGSFTFTGTQNLDLGTGTVTMNANSTLTVSANTLTVGGTINGPFNLTKAGVGTLSMGANPVTLNNLTISAGTLTAPSATLNIAGDFNNSATFTHNNGTVNYNGSTQAMASVIYNNLTISNGGNKNLQGATSIVSALNLTSGVLKLGSYNLTFSGVSGPAAITGTFSNTNMIETDGTGLLIFTNAALPNTALNGTYPLGNNGTYNPIVISTLSGGAASRTLNLRVVIGQLFVNGINRYWEISHTGVTGTSLLSFKYNASEASSDITKYQPYTNISGSWALAPSASAIGVNPVTSTTVAALPATSLWTAATPGSFYSYQSGDWNSPSTWSTDPGGTTFTNPLNTIPGYLDVVTILSGRTVSLSSNVVTYGLDVTISQGGFLDLGATSSFTNGLIALSGQGTLKLASVNFPTAVTNNFVNAGGGTTEYDANISLPSSQTTYNNITINTAGTAILVSNITLNGNLLIKQGTFQINDATARRLQLTVNGNVTVNNGTTISVGAGVTNTTTDPTSISGGAGPFTNYYDGQSHRFVVKGDFTNNGTVKFTNLAYPVFNSFPSNGIATVYFQGSTNNTLTCNGTTDFYNLILDKGSDVTFSLTINSTAFNYFRLFGANTATIESAVANPNIRKALWIRNGTLDLKGLIAIPSLSEGATSSAPSSDYFIPSNGALLLDGPFVTILSTADNYTEVNAAYSLAGGSNGLYGINTSGAGSGLSILGNLQINNGYLSTRESSGILYWSYASGQFIMNGGTVDTKQFHNPEGGNNGLVSYFQTGGNMILRGRFQNIVAYPTVTSLTTPVISTVRNANGTDGSAGIGTLSINGNTANGFTMSGGTISIYDVCGTTPTSYALYVNCPTSNINVTGGTVQVIPTTGTNLADANYLINSNASLANFLINQASGTSIVQLNTNPLTVLQNLSIQSSGNFDANNLNVNVGGGFSIATSSTYNSGTNTTTFNGSADQLFTINGTINNGAAGLSKLVINKTTGKLSLAGSQSSLTVQGTFDLTKGTFDDVGKTIYVGGNITNSGTHASTPGTGKIQLNGTSAQTIGGDGNGIFQNIDLNNTTGVSAPVSLVSNIQIAGTLNLVSNKIFNIGTNNLKINASGSITSTPGFSASCYIQSNGLSGDGGVTKIYSASSTSFTFPIGAPTLTPALSTAYTPATISITTTPTTWGSVTITPVGIEQPATTTKGVNLTYYWRVKSSGFSGLVAGSVTHSYIYNSADVPNPGQIGNYVPARYDESTFSWTSGTTASINTASNTIGLGAGDPFMTNTNNIDGDYTAGLAADFGVPQKFYSYNCPKASGGGQWNNVNTWSLTSHTVNNPPGAKPGASDIVLIGNNDSVYIATNPDLVSQDYEIEKCANLQIDKGSALDIGYNPGCNFSLVSSSAMGNGTFRLTTSYSDGSTYVFPSGDFSDFNVNVGTTVLYSINPNAGTTYWLPQGVTSYGNLLLAPLGGSNIIFANNDITVYGNLVIQGQNADSWFCPNWVNQSPYPTDPKPLVAKTITIKGNLDIQSGGLIWIGNGAIAQDFVVYGDVKVGTWAALMVWAGWGGATNQSMAIGGNLINNTNDQTGNGASDTHSYVDFSSNGGIPITFFGSSNASITNTSGTPHTVFGNVTVNKGSSQATTLTCNIGNILTTPVDNWLTMQNGTFIYNRTGDFTISQGTSFNIPATTGLTINTPSNVFIADAASDNNDLFLSGKLKLASGNTGNVYIGQAAAPNNNNDIEYSSGGSSAIQVDGGNLIVNGQIRRNPSNAAGILSYTQSNGNVTINGNNCVAPYNDNGKLEILNSGSQFNMSGGTLTIVRGGGGAFGDLYLRPQTSSVTGGAILFSQGALAISPNYLLDANISLNNLTITGAAGQPAKVTLMVSPLLVNGNLTINSNSTLDANVSLNIPVTINGNFSNSGTYTPQKNLTAFNGNTQNILGTTTPDIFYDLNVNPVTSLTLNGNTTVSDNLSISSGSLICGAYKVSVSGSFTNNGTYTDNIALGTGVSFVGSSLQHVAGSGTFGWLELNNAAGAVLDNNLTLNEHLTLTQGIFNIKQNLLTLQQNSTIDANGTPFSSTKMVTTDGVFSNIGIKKFFTTAPQTFTYPLGTSGKFTPATLTLTASDYVGSVRVNNINSSQPAVIDPTNTLSYYWDVESSGISGFAGSLAFNYLAGDVVGGPESNYQSAWLIVPGTSWSINGGVVVPASKTITFNYPAGTENLSGEYTAGLPASFPPNVPEYTSNSSGNWNNPSIWTQTAGTAHPLATGPNGFIVIINTGNIVTANTNYCSAYQTTINGKLQLNAATYGHNLGTVNGNGTLSLQSGNFPAGVFNSFFDCANNGTIEYGGTGSYSIIADLYDHLPNLLLSGTGTRTLPDRDLTICNSFKIDGPTADNSVYNRKLTIQGTMERYNTGIFNSGTGAGATVTFAGSSAQAIGGAAFTGDFTGSSAFNNLEISNSAGLSINTNGIIGMTGNLLLTDGLINTSTTNSLTITNTAINCVTPAGGSATSYINGPLIKKINQGDNFAFPIGTYLGGIGNVPGNRISVSSTQTGPLFWTAQYIDPNSSFNSYLAPLAAVSWDEYWSVSATPGSQAVIKLNYYPNSDVTPLVTQNGITDMRVALYNPGTLQWNSITSTSSGDNYNGSVATTSNITIDASGTSNYTLASVTTVLPKAKLAPTGPVCGIAGIPVTFSGPGAIPLNYSLSYKLNNVDQTPITISSVPYTLPTTFGGSSATYQLTGFTYNGGAGTGVVDANPITAYASPPTANAGTPQSVCGITNVTLSGNDPSPYTGLWSIVSGAGGTVLAPTTPGSQFNGVLPNSYTLQWTISNVTCKSKSNVTVAFVSRPDKPTALSAQSFCTGSTVSNLVANATAGSINWYSSSAYPPSAPSLLASSASLSNAVTYYGNAVVGTCISASPLTPVTVTLFPQPTGPTLNVKTPNLASVCDGTFVNSTISAGSGGVGCSDTYQYRFDGGSWIAYTSGTALNTSGHTSVDIQGQRAGCTTGAGCTGTSMVTLASWTVNSLPTPTFAVQPGANACSSSDVTYTTQASQSNYLWSVPGVLNTDYSITSGGLGVASSTVTLKWLTTGSKTITINYTDGNGCTAASVASSTATTVNGTPSINPGATLATCGIIPINLSDVTITNAQSILWSAGSGSFDDATIQNPAYTSISSLSDQAIVLTINVTALPGCTNINTTKNINIYSIPNTSLIHHD